jgi:selenocysteine lyase/cysteine desulfurase
MPPGRRAVLFGLASAALAARHALGGPLDGGALPATGPAAPARPDTPVLPAPASEFPWAATETFINSAAYHPISAASSRAMEDYLSYRRQGPGPGREDVSGARQEEVKAMFGRLINARASEIAFVQSTSDGENVVIAGLDLPRSGGNVVIDDLHYNSSIYIYRMLEAQGLEVRVVKQRDWTIDVRDVERTVDRNTKLVSMALVSNVNGYLHDVKAVSDVAHANGAYVYADIIQAAGAVVVDVKAMGLDMCACSTYKWLMGDRGLGFLYVREDLQGSVVRFTRYGHRQYSAFNRADFSWTARGGAYRYETGNIPNVVVAGMHEALGYILAVGVPRIRDHARPLTDRLQRELPAMGYASITPRGTETPIVTFLLKDPDDTRKRLARANVAVTVLDQTRQMRVSPSVFNTQADVDRLIEALA